MTLIARMTLAQAAGTFTTTEFDIPESLPALLGCTAALVGVVAFVVWIYRRDTAELSRGWRIWLTGLRLGGLAALVVILLNPHERTQRSTVRPSEVAILFDTSASMQFPARDGAADSGAEPTRAAAARELFFGSDLFERLNQRHSISVYTFDSELAGPHRSLPRPDPASAEPDSLPVAADWEALLRPQGAESRLGEAAQELIGRAAGPTLSGVVIVTDGGSNAGLDPAVANQKARSTGTRLVTVGVGSTRPATNITIANLRSPTEVHIGDPFEISVFVQGQGAAGLPVDVELLARAEGSDKDPLLIERKSAQLVDDGAPVEVVFRQKPASPGGVEYEVRVRPQQAVRELSEKDNTRRRTITVSERQIRVLLVSGGPSRDYRFLRDMLFRHTGMELDVWLQTVDAARASIVSQDAKQVLTRFPAERTELFEYDAVVAFDVDWSRVETDSLALLREWVAEHAGGIITVCGPIHTAKVVSEENLQPIRELLPVYLSPFLLDLELSRRNTQPWPVELTPEGREAPFLQLEEPGSSVDTWKEFSGVHRCYPTAGAKDGATVLAWFTNPRAQTEHGKPILIASQYFGAGRSLFLGTGETWRLRALSPDHFNRFWTKAIRDVAQGRIKRGNSRGVLMLDRTEFTLGQSVRVRAQLYDASLNPLEAETVPVVVLDPAGQPLLPQRVLRRDKNRPGQFVGSFQAGEPGTWTLSLKIPESRETLTTRIEVLRPDLESDNPIQDVALLERLAADTGGRYLSLASAAAELPELLPDRSEAVMIDERLRPLWDRHWVLYLIVGLFGLEWLTRKLLKLA